MISKRLFVGISVVLLFIGVNLSFHLPKTPCPLRESVSDSEFPELKQGFSLTEAEAIPAWSRRYNSNCTMCHTMYPRLNPVGHQFRRLGYRMPGEFDDKEVHFAPEELAKFTNYFSARGRARVAYANSSDDPDDFDFEMHDVTLFYAGPVTRNIAFFFELPFEPSEGNAFLEVGQMNLNFGKSDGFFFTRFGQMHQFSRVGYGGLDRPIGLNNPRVFDVQVNGFRPRQDGVGIEGGFSNGNFTGLVQFTNGIKAAGGSVLDNEDENNHKDVGVLLEYLIPNHDASASFLYVFGQAPTPVDDTGAQIPGADDTRYHRFYLFGDYTFESIGLKPLIGGAIGIDNQFISGLGTSAATLVSSDDSISWFAFAELDQKILDNLYGIARFDYNDATNKAEGSGDTRRTWMATGGVAWAFQSYFRLTAEYQAVDTAVQATDHLARLEAMLNF